MNDKEYFNFDLEKIKEAMEQKGETMPVINSFEELEEWLDRDNKFSLYDLLKGKREKPCFNLKSKFFK